MTINVAQYWDGPIRSIEHCKACDVLAGDRLEFYVCIENDEYDWVTRSVVSAAEVDDEIVFELKADGRQYQWRCKQHKLLLRVVWRSATGQEKALAVLEALIVAVRGGVCSGVTVTQYQEAAAYFFEFAICS